MSDHSVTARLPLEGEPYDTKRISGIMGSFPGGYFDLGSQTVSALNAPGETVADTRVKLRQWGCAPVANRQS